MDRWMAVSIVLAIALGGVLIQTGVIELNLNGDFSDIANGVDNADTPANSAPTSTTNVNQQRVTDTPFDYTTVALADFQRQHLERRIAELINDERESRGLSAIGYDARLARIARYHSEDMVVNDYFGHTAPDGETLSDRYDRFDYDCQNEVGSSRFSTGGENIFQTWYKTQVEDGYGSGFYSSRDELARAILHGWMQSEQHRELLLETRWQDQGVGVALEDVGGDVMVIITLNVC